VVVEGRLGVEDLQPESVEVASKLRGTTLLVYWYLIVNRRRNVGPREIQRVLNLRSPSTVLFHLNKLVSMNLVQSDGFGSYRVSTVKKVGIMQSFVSAFNFLIPKPLLYALFSTTLLISSFVLLHQYIVGLLFLAWLPSLVATFIFWYETFVVWRLRPRFQRKRT